jgi:porphobilinogen synthase
MQRFRPFRKDQQTRDLYAQVSVSPADLIYPYFLVDGTNQRQPIGSMTGIDRLSVDGLLPDVEEALKLGIDKFLLFGVIDDKFKDDKGSAAYSRENLISRAVTAIRGHFPEATVITDVCLCEYTSHGHCGLVQGQGVDNDSTLPLLAEMALSHARAGASFVAPSAMMDGQVEAIRKLLDANGLSTKILAYSAKYASGFYGPFRDAAGSAPSFGDRKSYQMDYRSIDQALDEAGADIDEGADWIMVKPAHTYLDIIQRMRQKFQTITLAAYQVSGEYMMIKAAAGAGYLNEEAAMLEALTSIKRAGADKIITYYAKDFVRKSL